jgi:hypothetical protein
MAEQSLEYDREFRWKNNPVRARLHKKRCRVVATGSTGHSVLLEFEDGTRIVTSRRATKRVR